MQAALEQARGDRNPTRLPARVRKRDALGEGHFPPLKRARSSYVQRTVEDVGGPSGVKSPNRDTNEQRNFLVQTRPRERRGRPAEGGSSWRNTLERPADPFHRTVSMLYRAVEKATFILVSEDHNFGRSRRAREIRFSLSVMLNGGDLRRVTENMSQTQTTPLIERVQGALEGHLSTSRDYWRRASENVPRYMLLKDTRSLRRLEEVMFRPPGMKYELELNEELREAIGRSRLGAGDQ